MASRMILGGINENAFEPNRSITRGEFATTITKALGLKYDKTVKSFVDVKEGEWYYQPIHIAHQ